VRERIRDSNSGIGVAEVCIGGPAEFRRSKPRAGALRIAA
jgi:hypothetical protein